MHFIEVNEKHFNVLTISEIFTNVSIKRFSAGTIHFQVNVVNSLSLYSTTTVFH